MMLSLQVVIHFYQFQVSTATFKLLLQHVLSGRATENVLDGPAKENNVIVVNECSKVTIFQFLQGQQGSLPGGGREDLQR